MARAKILLAALLLSAQSFALAHDHEHTWADELCDVCVLSQNLETGHELPATLELAWPAFSFSDLKSDYVCDQPLPTRYQPRAPPLSA